jgi:hypothetical protein
MAMYDFDMGDEVSGGLSDKIKEHFGVKETGEVLAKVVSSTIPYAAAVDIPSSTSSSPTSRLHQLATFANSDYPRSPFPFYLVMLRETLWPFVSSASQHPL